MFLALQLAGRDLWHDRLMSACMMAAMAAVIAPLLLLFSPQMSRAAAEDAGETPLSLLAINVRKADALLLRSGESAYLIDTGTEESAEALLAALEAEGVSRLTGVILTHTHKDHVGGLTALLSSGIEIENVYASGFYNKKKESKHPAVKALKGSDQEVIFLLSGDSLPLDGGTLRVLGPLEKNEDAENCNSLVLLAEGGGGSILLTGDMEFPEERSLLGASLIPHADVLKIGISNGLNMFYDDGEGYISKDGINWESVEEKANGNLCLKVYTNDVGD